MATFKSPDYKTPACESGVGNVSCDIMKYTVTGNESLLDVVKLRRMSARNTYLSIKVVLSAAMAALTTLNVGYVTREADGTTVIDAFAADVDATAVETELLTAPVEVGEEHDFAVELTTTMAAEGDKVITVIATFINASG